MISSERNFLRKMIFNKLRIFGVIFACVFTLHGFADEECENEQYHINNECKYCNAGYCVDNGECVACPAGYKCPESNGNLLCSTVKSEHVCPVNTYSDAGKTSCTSCGIGYTTGNSGPIVTDSEDNVSGDGLCLAFDDESGLGYGCISSRACQMVTPYLCRGSCSCNISDKIDSIIGKESFGLLLGCGIPMQVAIILINSKDKGIVNRIKKSIQNNKKLSRCLCNTSFVLGDNVTTVKTYSDVVDVVYPDDSASD